MLCRSSKADERAYKVQLVFAVIVLMLYHSSQADEQACQVQIGLTFSCTCCTRAVKKVLAGVQDIICFFAVCVDMLCQSGQAGERAYEILYCIFSYFPGATECLSACVRLQPASVEEQL